MTTPTPEDTVAPTPTPEGTPTATVPVEVPVEVFQKAKETTPASQAKKEVKM